MHACTPTSFANETGVAICGLPGFVLVCEQLLVCRGVLPVSYHVLVLIAQATRLNYGCQTYISRYQLLQQSCTDTAQVLSVAVFFGTDKLNQEYIVKTRLPGN